MSAIGRLHHLAFDTREPRRDAEFWSALLGWPITYESEDWVVVAEDDHSSGIAFQLAADHRPPVWGDPERPQQAHYDVMVDDLAVGEQRVAALGGVQAARSGGRLGLGRSVGTPVLSHQAAGVGSADRVSGH